MLRFLRTTLSVCRDTVLSSPSRVCPRQEKKGKIQNLGLSGEGGFEFKEVASVPKICMALKNNPSLKLILSLFLYETSGKLNLQVI